MLGFSTRILRHSVILKSAGNSITNPSGNLRFLHSSSPNENLIATCFGLAGAAYGTSKLLEIYANRKPAEPVEPTGGAESASSSAPGGGGASSNWFGSLLSPGAFYQGGFEDTMTKREAALILGVRESATRDKIRDAHRNMSRFNHPDTGGSPYLAMKINEAKDLLLNSK